MNPAISPLKGFVCQPMGEGPSALKSWIAFRKATWVDGLSLSTAFSIRFASLKITVQLIGIIYHL